VSLNGEMPTSTSVTPDDLVIRLWPRERAPSFPSHVTYVRNLATIEAWES